jgi:hypothetical protein
MRIQIMVMIDTHGIRTAAPRYSAATASKLELANAAPSSSASLRFASEDGERGST